VHPIYCDIYFVLPSAFDILRYILSCRAIAIYDLPINLRYIYKRVSPLVAIIIVFLVESESSQAWVAEQQLQPLNGVSKTYNVVEVFIHCPMRCTPATFVHNVHIYAWNIEQQLQCLTFLNSKARRSADQPLLFFWLTSMFVVLRRRATPEL